MSDVDPLDQLKGHCRNARYAQALELVKLQAKLEDLEKELTKAIWPQSDPREACLFIDVGARHTRYAQPLHDGAVQHRIRGDFPLARIHLSSDEIAGDSPRRWPMTDIYQHPDELVGLPRGDVVVIDLDHALFESLDHQARQQRAA